jgi:hypothetical protein
MLRTLVYAGKRFPTDSKLVDSEINLRVARTRIQCQTIVNQINEV